MFRSTIFLAPPLLLLLASGATAEPWHLEGCQVRRLFHVKGGSVAEEGDVGRVRFLSMGFMKDDASDVRVIGPQGPLPYQILSTGLDECRLAVVLKPGIRHFHVYYGNPNPTEPPAPAEIERGLVLETRRFQGGDCANWEQMKALVRKSGPSLGKDFVPQVYHGYNPFGPSDNYVSIYHGWIVPPETGRYVFSTTSDDASFLLVNGKLVVSKPRWGGAVRNARFRSGPVPLRGGRRYPFEYYHVEGTDYQAAVAAWQPPGQGFGLIPASAFSGVYECRPGTLQIKDRPISPDFQPVNQGEAIFQGKTYFRFEFKDRTLGDAFTYRPKWDFGDGCTSGDRNPVHIYLENRAYTVTFCLTKGGKEHRVSQRLESNWDWEKQLRRSRDTVEDYYAHLKKYQFKGMSTAALESAFEIFRELGHPEELIEVAHNLLVRDGTLKDESKVFACALEYGRNLCRQRKEYKRAIEAFVFADKHVSDRTKKAKLGVEIGDVYLFYLEDLPAARKQFESVLSEFADLKDSILRQAQIRVGEVHMRLGESAKAIAAFETAEKMPSYEREFGQKFAFLGAVPQRIENYLQRGELDEAENELNRWEWDYPLERLIGASSLWRARLARKREHHDEVVKQALILVHVSPQSKYAVELLLEAADACEAKKDVAAARKLLERIKEEYPETPFQDEVRLRIERLKGAGNGLQRGGPGG